MAGVEPELEPGVEPEVGTGTVTIPGLVSRWVWVELGVVGGILGIGQALNESEMAILLFICTIIGE